MVFNFINYKNKVEYKILKSLGTCIMNESMLTGESVPCIKNALPYNNAKYNANEDNKISTLFSGTKCLETRYCYYFYYLHYFYFLYYLLKKKILIIIK